MTTALRPPFWRRMILSRGTQALIDAALAAGALALAYLLRFDGWPPAPYLRQALLFLPWWCAARLVANLAGHTYRRVWRYTSTPEALHLLRVSIGPSLIPLALRLSPWPEGNRWRWPMSVIVLEYLLFVGAAASVRLTRRMLAERHERARWGGSTQAKRVLLIGAGNAGVMVAREFQSRPDLGIQLVGFLDDDPLKYGAIIQGVPVLGSLADLEATVATLRVDEVIVTMSSVPARTIRHVVESCEAIQAPVRIVPGLFEILGGRVSTSNLHPVEVEDLLGRTSFDVERWLKACRSFYRNQTVLVTGGAGSIGRELCRQLAMVEPDQILVLDKDENSVFETMQALQHSAGTAAARVRPIVGNLSVRPTLERVIRDFRPTLVFHAAAHKHVHLMEHNVCEAVLNNVGGTANLLACVRASSVRRCVMVSTDKAVNPTNVMGATKRVAELMFQAAAIEDPDVSYCSVRFGNVLGSRGSVIPIFREQIARGGPVTVTHPDVTRYFMTIPEAAHLILQAAILGGNGEIFLLDMGRPVRIVDLARDMIRLSRRSAEADRDIEIQFIGLRPGEKLHEELLIAGEGAQPTEVERIFKSSPADFPLYSVGERAAALVRTAATGDEDSALAALEAMAIGYHRHTRSVAAAGA
jgi:FlaA1/EpsC-like NDP-sugar epimerase